MFLKEKYVTELKSLKEKAHQSGDRFEEASVYDILQRLSKNNSAANVVSNDLLKSKRDPQRFSHDYQEFLCSYDISGLMAEGLKFGETLTVVVAFDREVRHEVQLNEGDESIDYGGLNKLESYSFFNILMHYPEGAKIFEYIESRLKLKFPKSTVSRQLI